MPSSLPPVVVIHGFLSTRHTNLPVHLTLWKRGYRTVDVTLPGLNTQDPRMAAPAVHDAVLAALDGSGGEAHLIGVSLGGLIGLAYLRAYGARHVQRFVALGAPFQGTRAGQLGEALEPWLGSWRATRTLGLMAVDSELVSWLNAEPVEDVEVYAMYAEHDPVVPHPHATLPWAHNVRSRVDRWPLGHHQMILAPRNLSLMADLIERGEAAIPAT